MNFHLIITFILRDISKNVVVLSLIILTLSLACVTILLTGGILSGFKLTLSESAKNWLADIIIIPPEDKKVISHSQDIAQSLSSFKEVSAVSIRSRGNLSVQFKEKISYPYITIGVDPVTEKNTSVLSSSVIEGSFLSEIEDPTEVLLGRTIADDLRQSSDDGIRVHANDTIEILFQDGTSKKFRVSGIIDVKNAYPNSAVFFHKNTLDNFPGTLRNRMIIIKKTPESDEKRLQSAIQQMFPSLIVHTWLDESGYIKDVLNGVSFITSAISSILILSIAVIIAIIIYINIIQKRRQIGILKSMGVSNNFIFIVYLFEAVAYFFFAFFIGLLLFFGIHLYSVHHPLPMLIGNFHTSASLQMILLYFLIILSSTVFGCILPTRIALKTKIIDVLRNTV